MKHYDPLTVKKQHGRAKARLAEIKAEIASIQTRGLNDRYKEQLIQPLLREQSQLQNEIWEMETSHAWRTADEMQKANEQRERERQLLARQQQRSARIQAEREAYQAQVDAIDWSLVSLPEWAKCEVAREHIAKLQEFKERQAMLKSPNLDGIVSQLAEQHGIAAESIKAAMQTKGFETKAVDRETGKHYIIITDSDGYTYVQSDVSSIGDDD